MLHYSKLINSKGGERVWSCANAAGDDNEDNYNNDNDENNDNHDNDIMDNNIMTTITMI